MAHDAQDDFYGRADAHIRMSNDQAKQVEREKVNASMMYGTARFNTWTEACEHESGASLAAARQGAIANLVNVYRAMLEENFEEYVANFDDYMKPRQEH